MYTYQDFKNWVEQNPTRRKNLAGDIYIKSWDEKIETNLIDVETKWSSELNRYRKARPYVDDEHSSDMMKTRVAIKYWVSELDEANLKRDLEETKGKIRGLETENQQAQSLNQQLNIEAAAAKRQSADLQIQLKKLQEELTVKSVEHEHEVNSQSKKLEKVKKQLSLWRSLIEGKKPKERKGWGWW